MYCPNCNWLIPDDADHCMHCGTVFYSNQSQSNEQSEDYTQSYSETSASVPNVPPPPITTHQNNIPQQQANATNNTTENSSNNGGGSSLIVIFIVIAGLFFGIKSLFFSDTDFLGSKANMTPTEWAKENHDIILTMMYNDCQINRWLNDYEIHRGYRYKTLHYFDGIKECNDKLMIRIDKDLHNYNNQNTKELQIDIREHLWKQKEFRSKLITSTLLKKDAKVMGFELTKYGISSTDQINWLITASGSLYRYKPWLDFKRRADQN